MATLISEFDDPPGAAQRPEEPPAVDLAAAAATGDVEALRRAFEAQLAAQEQRHAAELRAAHIGDAKVPLLGATKRLLAEADAMRASRTRGTDDGSDDEDVFAGPTTDESGPPADVARAIAAARALPEHRRHDAYAVDLCLAEHAWAAEDWGRARVACRRVLRAAERVSTERSTATDDAVAVLERARGGPRPRRRRRREFVGLCFVKWRLRARFVVGGADRGAARPAARRRPRPRRWRTAR